MNTDVVTDITEKVLMEGEERLSVVTEKLLELSLDLGERLLWAILVFFAGRFLIRMVDRVFKRILDRRMPNSGVRTFLKSMVHILLTVLLIVSVIGTLGISTTSFAALLASAGVAVGMALSGNLQNFAGGVIILIFKPYRVGDYVETKDASGTVREIQIFHTILTTSDNRTVYMPNGAMSSGVITNYNRRSTRRVEWKFGIEYGEDFEKVKGILLEILATDSRIQESPAPFIVLHGLEASCVNVMVRVWVETGDYWGVYFDTNKKVYETFNAQGISFPFPQLTVHTEK